MLVIIRRTINIWTRIVKVWVELILYECGNNLIQRITFLIFLRVRDISNNHKLSSRVLTGSNNTCLGKHVFECVGEDVLIVGLVLSL